MDVNRRDWLRTLGSLGVAGGVAGCAGGAGDDDNGTTVSGSDSSAESGAETTDDAANAPADEQSNESETESTGPRTNAASTDKKGVVATDKQTSGLSFTEQYHYSMNGVQGVAGKLTNETDTEFESVTVHVTVEPGGAGPYTRGLDDSLPAGETRRFQFRFGDDAPSDVESYTLWATGEQ